MTFIPLVSSDSRFYHFKIWYHGYFTFIPFFKDATNWTLNKLFWDPAILKIFQQIYQKPIISIEVASTRSFEFNCLTNVALGNNLVMELAEKTFQLILAQKNFT